MSSELENMLEEVQKLQKTQSHMMTALNDDLEGMIVEASTANRENHRMLENTIATDKDASVGKDGKLGISLSAMFRRNKGSTKSGAKDGAKSGAKETSQDYTEQLEEEMETSWEGTESAVHNIKVNQSQCPHLKCPGDRGRRRWRGKNFPNQAAHQEEVQSAGQEVVSDLITGDDIKAWLRGSALGTGNCYTTQAHTMWQSCLSNLVNLCCDIVIS